MSARAVGEVEISIRLHAEDPSTVCENCGTSLLSVWVRLDDGRGFRRAWLEQDQIPSVAEHTPERCRETRHREETR